MRHLKEKGGFKSLYEEALGKEPDFTTFKWRAKDGYVKRTIDYILLRNSESQVLSHWPLPKDEQLDLELAFPTPEHPSDHLALGVEI